VGGGRRGGADSVTLTIYPEGATEAIRTFRAKADSGFNRTYWNFSTKGVRQPGSARGGGGRRGGSEPTGGMPASPGKYKVVISAGPGAADSTMLTLQYDPRQPFNAEIYAAQKGMIDRLQRITEKLTAATDQLTAQEEVARKMEAQLREVEGKPADTLRKATRAMQDSIKNIREFMNGKTREKQGYGSPYQVTVTGKLREAQFLITGKNAMPGAQEEQAVALAESLVKQVLSKVNAFTTGPWADYRKLADTNPVKLFTDLKPLE
jgi:hypothetical protein